MSTRACYIFKDGDQEIAVYKHSDGYPEGAKEALAKALDFAWPLPRYEADEFAAAFVAANKMSDSLSAAKVKGDTSYDCVQGGGVRLLAGLWDYFPADLAYVYQVEQVGKQLKVKAWEVNYNDDAPTRDLRWTKRPIKGWTIAPSKTKRRWVRLPDAMVPGKVVAKVEAIMKRLAFGEDTPVMTETEAAVAKLFWPRLKVKKATVLKPK